VGVQSSEGSGAGEAKILWALTEEIAGGSGIEDLGRKQAALGGNGSVGHTGSPCDDAENGAS